MLQRAASNAYSWWWASHIRTTQSKWLDTHLHEMEARVKAMIKLIEADADSFGKKAELYFRSRPELINYVEETYKSYQALADRYDRISGELHKANHTIATAFPDQVQLSMQDEDGDGFLKAITGINISKLQQQPMEAPEARLQDESRETSPIPKKPHHRRISSHMNKDKAQEEIDRLQKKILVLQTEKEFVKSSYDNGLAKYLNIERQIMEMQEEVCCLQDAFSTSAFIEDNEARALMAARAIFSCEDTLVSLQEQQKRSFEEARTEFQRISEARQKLRAIETECGQPYTENKESSDKDVEQSLFTEDNVCILKEGRLELQSICQKVKEQFELSSEASVLELAENVDDLVDNVIGLELAASSQSAQVNRMRTEVDELHKFLHFVEEDKTAMINDSNLLAERLKRAEEVLQAIQPVEKSVQNEKCNIQKQLSEACNSLNDLLEKLQNLEHQNSKAVVDLCQDGNVFTSKDSKDNISEEGAPKHETLSELPQDESSESVDNPSSEAQTQDEESEDSFVWQQLVLNGLEGKEKILLKEYSSILRNYKDTKKRLSEIEKKNKEYHLKAMTELKELKGANAMKDDEIRSLRRMLSSLQTRFNGTVPQNVGKSEEVAKTSTTAACEDKENLEVEEYIKLCHVEGPHISSAIEGKLRAEINTILEENLDFWLRFSTSYHQIQNFQTSFDKLKAEMDRLTDVKAQEGSDSVPAGSLMIKEDSAPFEKKFRELNTGLQVWFEKNVLLKGELENRFSSLCNIQEDIAKISMMSETEDVQFTPFQAAKFQGEVLNMKQENNKVAKELQIGLDHIRGLQVEVGRALSKLRENFELSVSRSNRAQHNFRNLSTKAGIPLRTFLFGKKPKKPSIFSCMSPALQKQYSDVRAGFYR